MQSPRLVFLLDEDPALFRIGVKRRGIVGAQLLGTVEAEDPDHRVVDVLETGGRSAAEETFGDVLVDRIEQGLAAREGPLRFDLLGDVGQHGQGAVCFGSVFSLHRGREETLEDSTRPRLQGQRLSLEGVLEKEPLDQSLGPEWIRGKLAQRSAPDVGGIEVQCIREEPARGEDHAVRRER